MTNISRMIRTVSAALAASAVIVAGVVIRQDDSSASAHAGTAETIAPPISALRPAATSTVVTTVAPSDADEVLSSPSSVTLELRISSSTDDAEQRSSKTSTESSDLELVRDGSINQHIGLRFNDLQIPRGALILNSWLQFEAGEASSDPTSLLISAAATDNAGPLTPLTRITALAQTTQQVTWDVPEWPSAGHATEAQQTPDLSGVISEITSRPGWNARNALTFVIAGSGHRVATSFDGDPDAAPLLHIEFATTTNEPPWADAGPDAVARVGASVALHGTVSNDVSSETSSAVSAMWSTLSGPGAVEFVDPTSAATLATFSLPGTYVVQLSADDGATVTTDTAKVTGTALVSPTWECTRGDIVIEGEQLEQLQIKAFPGGSTLQATSAEWIAADNWPVDLRGTTGPGCLLGGRVAGEYSQQSPWELFHGTGAVNIAIPSFVIDGVDIDNYGDAIRIRENAPDFAIRDVRLRRIHDDCIENDFLHSGTVDGALLDGCYVGFSARPSAGDTQVASPGAVWTIRNTLVRLEATETVHSGPAPGHGGFFKWSDVGPSLSLHNNIFRVDQAPNHQNLGIPESALASCSDNIMVWLGDGPFPDYLPDCFTLTTDVSVWTTAVERWYSAE
jgi:hypothetical protein